MRLAELLLLATLYYSRPAITSSRFLVSVPEDPDLPGGIGGQNVLAMALDPPLIFPSYEEQHAADVAQYGDFAYEDTVGISGDARRIHWTVDHASLETAFLVVDHGNLLDPRDTPEPYYLGDGKWHRYSQSAYTTKPVSSIRVTDIDPFPVFEADWERTHGRHYDPRRERRWSDPPVMECPCGSIRPAEKSADVTVKGTGTPGRFVTVHDFLSTVHTYLWERRAEVLEAMELDLARRGAKFGAETKLIVSLLAAGKVAVTSEEEWRRYNTESTIHGGRTPGATVYMIGLSDDGAPPRMPHPLPALDYSLWEISRLHAEQMWERGEMARRYAEEMEATQGQPASMGGEGGGELMSSIGP